MLNARNGYVFASLILSVYSLAACSKDVKKTADTPIELVTTNEVSTNVVAPASQQMLPPVPPPQSITIAQPEVVSGDPSPLPPSQYSGETSMPQNPNSRDNSSRATTQNVNAEALRLRASGVEVGVKLADDISNEPSQPISPQ